jgi:hypothetical protein
MGINPTVNTASGAIDLKHITDKKALEKNVHEQEFLRAAFCDRDFCSKHRILRQQVDVVHAMSQAGQQISSPWFGVLRSIVKASLCMCSKITWSNMV